MYAPPKRALFTRSTVSSKSRSVSVGKPTMMSVVMFTSGTRFFSSWTSSRNCSLV